eukprot:50576_1
MANSERQSKDLLELLIYGYTSRHYPLFLSRDVIVIIQIYCNCHGMDFNSYLISFADHKTIKSYNISSQIAKKTFIKNIHHLSYIIQPNDFAQGKLYTSAICSPQHLPIYVLKNIKKHKDSLITDHDVLSDKWCMVVQRDMIKNRYIITAFHASIFNYDDYDITPMAYTFGLPPIISFTACNPTYNATKKQLYLFDSGKNCKSNGKLFALDFTVSNEHDNRWNDLSYNMKPHRSSARYCMVDGDKSIAVVGGGDGAGIKKFELHVLNCDTSIWLKNMIRARRNTLSVYHDTFFKLIVGGDVPLNGIEWYDFNKNEWIMIKRFLDKDFVRLSNMWISSLNPNIMCMSALTYNVNSLPGPLVGQRCFCNIWAMMDLRENNINKSFTIMDCKKYESYEEEGNLLMEENIAQNEILYMRC